MFKISDNDDDDDEFWKEFPLESFEVEPVSKAEKRRRSPIPVDCEQNKKLRTFTGDSEHLPDVIIPMSPEPSTSVSSSNKYPTKGATLANSLSQSLQQANYSKEKSPKCPSAKLQTDVTTEVNSKRTKRIFPGPAGILPKLVSSEQLEDVVLKLDTAGIKEKEKPVAVIPSSQTHEAFNEGPWKKLMSDLGEEASDILKKFSIKEIHRRASKKLLCQGKVLLLFSILDAIDFANFDASVHLRDKTGTIQGTVHRNLVNEYRDYLQPGTVLVLKNVGVISPTPRTHYLNITTNNLVSICSVLTSGEVNIHWQENNTSYSKLVANAQLVRNTKTPQRSGSPLPKSSEINSPKLPSSLNPLNGSPSRLPFPLPSHSRVSTPNALITSTPINFQSRICDKSSTPAHHVPNFQRNTSSSQSAEKVRPNFTAAGATPVSAASSQSSSADKKELLSQSSNSRWRFKSTKTLPKAPPEPGLKNPSGNTRNNPLLDSALNQLRNSSFVKLSSSMSGDKNSDSTTASVDDKYRLHSTPCQNGDSLDNKETVFQDDLWQDDLSDDVLSQISEDIF